MAQYRKDEIEEAIARAALAVFAERSYDGAAMAEIARTAGISIGNLYRYHEGKEALFEAVVPPELVIRFERLLRRRVGALGGVDDVDKLRRDAPYHEASEELLAFCLAHRLAVVILLGRARGSRHQDFAERVVQLLLKLAVRHFHRLRPDTKLTAALRFNLERIYRALIAAMVEALAQHEDEAAIREIVAGYSRYHLAGLSRLFS
ncbi:MAG: hypothetical protein JWN04_1775 [Myxococcaceae bacterium]|nr:hypothetical protein [Myxococcaceae bacterium]